MGENFHIEPQILFQKIGYQFNILEIIVIYFSIAKFFKFILVFI